MGMQVQNGAQGSAAQAAARRLGPGLVALQFSLLAVLGLLAAQGLMLRSTSWPGWIGVSAGLGLGLWALAVNRPGNFNIRPLPREGGQLILSGPYRWVRHPMYSALLLCGFGAVLMADRRGLAISALALLYAVLRVKAGVEERAMTESHPGYADHARRIGRFVPRLGSGPD
jgi:protein-S-isoprenylcysteine O-methyltransferase Ste14